MPAPRAVDVSGVTSNRKSIDPDLDPDPDPDLDPVSRFPLTMAAARIDNRDDEVASEVQQRLQSIAQEKSKQIPISTPLYQTCSPPQTYS